MPWVVVEIDLSYVSFFMFLGQPIEAKVRVSLKAEYCLACAHGHYNEISLSLIFCLHS